MSRHETTSEANPRPFTDYSRPGLTDADGAEWWACDPYPTWFRWEADELVTPTTGADEVLDARLRAMTADEEAS